MRIRFEPSSIRFLDAQTQSVRSKLIDDAVWLGDNPNHGTESILAAPVVLQLYRDEAHWIIYYFEADSMAIANIGEARERPHVWRPA